MSPPHTKIHRHLVNTNPRNRNNVHLSVAADLEGRIGAFQDVVATCYPASHLSRRSRLFGYPPWA